MNEKTMGYEAPALVEVGDFTELTRITNVGEWTDLWGGWFDL